AGRIGNRADGQIVEVRVADRAAVLGGKGVHVVGAVIQVHGPRAQNLQARGANRGGLGDRARDVQGQIVAAGDVDQIVDGQVAAGGQPDVGVVGNSAGGGDRCGGAGRIGDGADGQVVE